MKRLILIDGHALLHRAFHALPSLSTTTGKQVNAVYGFAQILIKALKDFQPQYIVVTFDKKAPTFRHLEFKEYKAKRPPTPKELSSQISLVKKMIAAFGFPYFGVEGYEADDLIGTLVCRYQDHKEVDEIVILTGDMDTLQLVGAKVKVCAPKRGVTDTILYDKEKVEEILKIKPDQIVDFKALKGDPSDNIPGVSGIGEKTAVELLENYGSLEKIYQNLERIKPSWGLKLEKGKENAFLSKRLAQLIIDVPLEFKIEKASLSNFTPLKLVDFFQELGFKSLVKRIKKMEDEGKIFEKTREDKAKQLKLIS